MRNLQTTQSSSTPYLFQSRHGIWYARLVVPKDQQLAFGRREVKKSLRTRCRSEAIKRSWQVLDQLNAGVKSEPREAAGKPSAAPALPPVPTPAPKDDSPKLSVVIEQFIAEKVRGNAWAEQELRNAQNVFKLLLEVVGDIQIRAFDGKVALKYKQHFLDEGKLTVSTINKRITRVGALLKWAASYYSNTNPLDGMTIKNNTPAKNQRKAVSDAKVRELLEQTKRHYHGSKDTFKRWLPFLAVYTGARLGELSQLYLNDFKVIQGIPCIMVQATQPDQSLKNYTSERAIPICQQLIDEGFLQFVEKQRALGHKRLFPELPSGNIRGFGHKPSLWFTKFKTRLRWGEGESFHSLRHSAITKLKREGYSSDLVAALVGHSHGSITFDRYGKEFQPKQIEPLVQALRY